SFGDWTLITMVINDRVRTRRRANESIDAMGAVGFCGRCRRRGTGPSHSTSGRGGYHTDRRNDRIAHRYAQHLVRRVRLRNDGGDLVGGGDLRPDPVAGDTAEHRIPLARGSQYRHY